MSFSDSMTHLSGHAGRPSLKRVLGTTLIEILVVIVVFLVGILAVIQIFPKGFQLLLLNRNKMISQALARDYVESLKLRPDQLPEQIVSAYYSNGNLVINSGKDPSDLGTIASFINSNGFASDGSGNALGNWAYFTGSNVFRRVIGEGRRVPAPRAVGTSSQFFGGLMVLQFGPISYQPQNGATPSNLSVYGNDLEQFVGLPNVQAQRTDYQYFVINPTNSAIAIEFPSGNLQQDTYNRVYRVSFSAYVSNGSGGVFKRDYTELAPVSIPPQNPDISGQAPLSAAIPLAGVNGLVTDPVVSVDLNTLRVQRFFVQLPKSGQAFSAVDPYQYKLLNENIGVLLFNPIGNGVFISREGHDREPLTARVNYDVYDWRILHDDFRVDIGVLPGEVSSANPQAVFAQHKLPVGGLKVAGNAGPDGLPNTPIPTLETARGDGTTDTSGANGPKADNFVLMDLDTGGIYCEVNPSNPSQNLISIDKSSGVVTFYDLDNDPTNGITGVILLPDGTTVNVQMDNRAVRALYMVNQEFSVQVLKSAAQYSVATTPTNLSVGQFYIGGTQTGLGSATRIYFPNSDNGRKVTIGEVTYVDGSGVTHDLMGQDFLVTGGNDATVALPFVDLTSVDPSAQSISFANGFGARNVKGASVTVRVLWNPTNFFLTGNSPQNLSSLNRWGQAWRKSTNETFLQKEDNNR